MTPLFGKKVRFERL